MKHLFITLIAMLALLYGKAYAQETQQGLPEFHYFKVTDKLDIVTLPPPKLLYGRKTRNVYANLPQS